MSLRSIAAASFAVAAFAAFGSGAASAGACVQKAAEGTGGTQKDAQFQVYEALLQATDWGAWAAWMANGTTPGYKVSTPKIQMRPGRPRIHVPRSSDDLQTVGDDGSLGARPL